jgi:hypothetical protein
MLRPSFCYGIVEKESEKDNGVVGLPRNILHLCVALSVRDLTNNKHYYSDAREVI